MHIKGRGERPHHLKFLKDLLFRRKFMKDKALNNYQNGCNCAQAILKTFSHKLEISDETAMKLASGLGVGMFSGETCGAVSAAYISLGFKYGGSDNSKAKEVFKKVKEYENAFKEKNISMNCKELKSVYKKDCRELVKDSAKLLEELL